jgi:2,4-dienoyl-CoA reductase-like NADH-dependent reductase (Old Yellow Enzyme family)
MSEDNSGGLTKGAGCLSDTDHDRNCPDVDLLSPLEIRGVKLKNRIVVSPMCQYSCEEGLADDWHLVHLGSRAAGGAALVFAEATAVTPEGRITPGDLGIWDDKHIEPLERVTHFIHRMGSVSAIQLAHAGRKASCHLPWQGGAKLSVEEGGWTAIAPSALAFNETDPIPEA